MITWRSGCRVFWRVCRLRRHQEGGEGINELQGVGRICCDEVECALLICSDVPGTKRYTALACMYKCYTNTTSRSATLFPYSRAVGEVHVCLQCIHMALVSSHFFFLPIRAPLATE